MELIDYLNQHFFTRAQLLAAACLAPEHLDALIRDGAMPKPSYRLRLALGCDSFFGPHAAEHAVEYYARGYAAWIGALQAAPRDPFGMFARRYREALAALPLESGDPKLNDGLDAHLHDEWGHFLDGTYGLCTRSGLPEDIAAKELAICVIRESTQSQAPDLARLQAAVDLLDRASSPFAPHERLRSSRHRYIDGIRARYGFDAKDICTERPGCK
ncbi:DUF6058 family natural product biosynthesis protein [Massilia sp. AB1]|uniref:DUF6058 family natural product biosynthesis protein n=1 Tax=Massilia sp. AB1 TaxID=2823371 RepID=UPI001B841107|nr:DUF6058 family natural product biosynthesis protein [Massilia sp. AB1]MBQ5942745.1 hypothetical protein [Massilia sp. AB1]